jgi:AcrR family transcriptional regulator
LDIVGLSKKNPHMRLKDETKKNALFKATIEVVNEEGFATSSVNKIAKRANVSPATLYIYFKNKEDLLVSTFIEIKSEFGQFVMSDFDLTRPIVDNLRQFWHQLFTFVLENPGKYQFIDQFSNSPYLQLVDMTGIEAQFAPLHHALHTAISQNIIKDISTPMLRAFILSPAVFLAQSRLSAGFVPSKENIEMAFLLSWEAISV